jgi:hypothetical protein
MFDCEPSRGPDPSFIQSAKFNSQDMKLVFLSCLAVCVLFAPKIHKFEDGFVERTMAVVVRGRTAHVQYAVGLNENTLRQVLQSWDDGQAVSPPSAPAPVDRPPATAQSGTQPRDVGDPSGQPSETGSATDSQPADTIDLAGTPTTDDSAIHLANTAPEKSQTAPGDQSVHFIDAKLMAKLKQSGPNEISKRVAIHCNGDPVTVTSATLGPTPRHPFTVVVKFEFQIPDSETFELKIDDSNFVNQAGAVRYALKATGNAAILQTDVAPILVRAQRVELPHLANNKRSLHSTISARLAILPIQKK